MAKCTETHPYAHKSTHMHTNLLPTCPARTSGAALKASPSFATLGLQQDRGYSKLATS